MKSLWLSVTLLQGFLAFDVLCPPVLAEASSAPSLLSYQAPKRGAVVLTKEEFAQLLAHNLEAHKKFYPTEVVAHHGYSSDYLYPFVLGQRLQEEVATHDKTAMHIVPLSKTGIGQVVVRMMNQINYREQGFLAVVVNRNQYSQVTHYRERADFVIVVDDGESPADVFSDLVISGAKSKAIEKDVYFYTEEGGRQALQTLTHLAAKSYYQLESTSKNIQVIADMNFNSIDAGETNGHMAATSLAMLYNNLATVSDKLQFSFTIHREGSNGSQLLQEGAPMRQRLTDVDPRDPGLKARIRQFTSGNLHLQHEIAFDLKNGQYLVMSWVDDGVLGVHIIYPENDSKAMEEGRFALNLTFDEKKIGQDQYTKKQVVSLDYGQKAIYFEMNAADLNLPADRMRKVYVGVKYSFKGEQDVFRKEELIRELGDGFVAATESQLMLLESQLIAAKRELAAFESSGSPLDKIQKIYQARWQLDDQTKLREYLASTVQTLTAEIEEKKNVAFDKIARTLRFDVGFAPCGAAFINPKVK